MASETTIPEWYREYLRECEQAGAYAETYDNLRAKREAAGGRPELTEQQYEAYAAHCRAHGDTPEPLEALRREQRARGRRPDAKDWRGWRWGFEEAEAEAQSRQGWRTCTSCGREHVPHKQFVAADFDATAALEALWQLEHSACGDPERFAAARSAESKLVRAERVTLTLLAEAEAKLRAGGFDNRAIAEANLDGGACSAALARVEGREALANALREALAAQRHAWVVAQLSNDPSVSAAFECIKVSLMAMLGNRGDDLPPLDCLSALRSVLREPNPKENQQAALRAVVELVRVRLPHVRRHGDRGATQEAKGLLGSLRAKFPGQFDGLSRAHVASLLARHLTKRGKGHLKDSGIVRELICQAGAWGFRATTDPDEDDKVGASACERAIANALGRGRSKAKAQRKQQKRRPKR